MLCVPWIASGAAAKERGNPYIDKATRLREQFEYDKALQVIEKAAKWPSNTPDQVVTIALLEGVLLFETNRPDLAEQSFQRALTLSPDAQLPLDASPKITGLLEKVRERVKPPVVEPPMVTTTAGGGEVPVEKPPGLNMSARFSPYRVPVAIAGGGVAIVGVLSWVRAKSLEQGLRTGDLSITTRAQFDKTLRQGKTFETVGWILAGAGAATALGSLLLLKSSPTAPTLGAAPMPGGAQVSLLWRTP